MRTHYYVDVSRYRAPYKGVAVQGFGQWQLPPIPSFPPIPGGVPGGMPGGFPPIPTGFPFPWPGQPPTMGTDPWTCVASGGIPTQDGRCVSWVGKSPQQVQCEVQGGSWIPGINVCAPPRSVPPQYVDPVAQMMCQLMGGRYDPASKTCASPSGTYHASELVAMSAEGTSPAPAAPPQPGQEYLSVLENRSDGLWYFKPDAKKAAENVLMWSIYQPIGGTSQRIAVMRLMNAEEAAKLIAGDKTMIERSAGLWVDRMKKDGKIVYAPPYVAAPVDGREVGYLEASDTAGQKMTAQYPQVAAILAYPGDESATTVQKGLSRNAKIALGIVALAGVGTAIYLKRRKRGGG